MLHKFLPWCLTLLGTFSVLIHGLISFSILRSQGQNTICDYSFPLEPLVTINIKFPLEVELSQNYYAVIKSQYPDPCQCEKFNFVALQKYFFISSANLNIIRFTVNR